MAQLGYPKADIATGTFTPTPNWAEIDETSPDDATTQLTSGSNPTEQTEYRLKLAGGGDLVDPTVDTGCSLEVRAYNSGTRTTRYIARLVQGTTVIWSGAQQTLTGAYATWNSGTIPSASIANITNWPDLRVRFDWDTTGGGAPGVAQLTWVRFTTPDPPPPAQSITPTPKAATFAVVAATLALGAAAITPTPIVATTSVVTPVVSAGGAPQALTPTPIVATASVVTPTLAATYGLTPTPIVATFRVNAGTQYWADDFTTGTDLELPSHNADWTKSYASACTMDAIASTDRATINAPSGVRSVAYHHAYKVASYVAEWDVDVADASPGDAEFSVNVKSDTNTEGYRVSASRFLGGFGVYRRNPTGLDQDYTSLYTLPSPGTSCHLKVEVRDTGSELRLRLFFPNGAVGEYSDTTASRHTDTTGATWANSQLFYQKSDAGSPADTSSYVDNLVVTQYPLVEMGGVGLTPTPIGATFAVVTPSVVGGSGAQAITPTPIPATYSVTSPSWAYGPAAIAPTPIAATWSVTSPTWTLGPAAIAPTPIPATWSVTSPVWTFGAVAIAPTPIPATWSVTSPVWTFGAVGLTPTPIAATWSVVAPTVVSGTAPQAITPTPIVATYSLTSPAWTFGAVGLTPTPIVATWSVVTPTVVLGAGIAPTPIVATWSVTSPAWTFGAVGLTPSPVTGTWSVVAPTLAAGAVALTPTPIPATYSITSPSWAYGPAAIAPTPIVATWSVVSPTLYAPGAAQAITPTPIGATVSLVTPALGVSGLTITPTPIGATWAVTSPTWAMGAVALTPTPIGAVWSVGVGVVQIPSAVAYYTTLRVGPRYGVAVTVDTESTVLTHHYARYRVKGP